MAVPEIGQTGVEIDGKMYAVTGWTIKREPLWRRLLNRLRRKHNYETVTYTMTYREADDE